MTARLAGVCLSLGALIVGCATTSEPNDAEQAASATSTKVETSIVVVSDVHVTTAPKVPETFHRVVARIVEMKPNAVVVVGDSTSGNADDTFGSARVAKWWEAFQGALAPLAAAKIPVLPVAGNHDYYRTVHREGYVNAWKGKETSLPFAVTGNWPLYYSVDIGNTHLDLLHIVDQTIERDVARWLGEDLQKEKARAAKFRFAFGHVPMVSVMGRTNTSFQRDFGTMLLNGNVEAYIAGHEHLAFDMRVPITGRDGKVRPLRQVTVGTASATYTYPLSQRVYDACCEGTHCKMPKGTLDDCDHDDAEHEFDLVPGTRQEKSKVAFTRIDVYADRYQVVPLTLDESEKPAPL